MNSLSLAIILQLLGVVVVIAEIVLPSGGLLSFLAIGIFGYSLFMVFHDISSTTGVLFVVADILLLPVLLIIGIKMLARSPATLQRTLSSAEGVTSQSPDLERFRGQEGRAVTILHPSGTAVINGQRLDVVSRGEYIDKDTPIEVVDVTGNQVIVGMKE